MAYSGETLYITDPLTLEDMRSGDLREFISKRTSLPYSMLRLFNKANQELLDCQPLSAYRVAAGSAVRLDTWPGLQDFLNLCIAGFVTHALNEISQEDELLARYQLRVALFIAAHYNHVDLANATLKQGARPGEPVGQHPSRAWTDSPIDRHPRMQRAPIHEAVEAGNLVLVKLFVIAEPVCVFSTDGDGVGPLKLAIQRRHLGIVLFLITSKYKRVDCGGSRPISMYVNYQTRRWADRARDRVLILQGIDHSSIRKRISLTRPRVGQQINVKGFDPAQHGIKSPLDPFYNPSRNAMFATEYRDARLEAASRAEDYFKRLSQQLSGRHSRGRSVSKTSTFLVPSLAIPTAAQQQRLQQRRTSIEPTESTFSTRSPTDQTEQRTRKESSSSRSTPFESENVSPENVKERPDSGRAVHMQRNRLPTLASIDLDETETEPEVLYAKEHSQVTFGKPLGGDETDAPHQLAAAKLHASAAAQKRANDERMKALAVLQSREKTRETSGFSLSGGMLGARESPSGAEKSTMRTRARSASLQRRPYYYIPSGERDYIESTLNAWQKRAGASFEDVAREALALTRGLRQRTWIHRVNHAAHLMRSQVRKVFESQSSSIVDAASARFASHTALPAVAERR